MAQRALGRRVHAAARRVLPGLRDVARGRSRSSALVGIIWAIAFYRWYRDDPRTHPSVNEAELALLPPPARTATVHGPIPWDRVPHAPRRLAALDSVRLSLLRLVVLHHLAADLSAGRARPRPEAGRRCWRACRCFSAASAAWCRATWRRTSPRRTGSVARSRRILAVTGFVCAVDRHHRLHAAAESDARHARARASRASSTTS